MSADGCGGCAGLGAHRRWCEAVVGRAASRFGPMSERVESMGDEIGGNNPGMANRCYELAARLRAWADELAELARRGQE
jgi:hypothetical protein